MSAYDDCLSDVGICEECEPFSRAEAEKMTEGLGPVEKEDTIQELLITCKFCDNLILEEGCQ
jgi:hypothetical protein